MQRLSVTGFSPILKINNGPRDFKLDYGVPINLNLNRDRVFPTDFDRPGARRRFCARLKDGLFRGPAAGTGHVAPAHHLAFGLRSYQPRHLRGRVAGHARRAIR